ncbi:MAG: ABC transporter ATP-binding protein [Deltaproteobacteria bacterium]|nr:ABC transporter ATP-binding protein [Deltaproteobacteria bacterium]
MNAIAVHGVEKNYPEGNVHALQGIDLDIREGEFFGLLGPNGAGKTTLISAITGLVKPDKGNIAILGHDIQKEPTEAKRQMALSPQEINIHYYFPIQKVMEFQGGFYGLSRKESKTRAEELLKRFSLWEKRKSGRTFLSGGMQRRLLIARALMGKPKILILDEPTAGVDVELRHELWDFLTKINQEGITILLTTHYIEEAERLCNRVGIIHKGKIVALDAPDRLIEKYASKEGDLRKGVSQFVRRRSLEEVFVNLTGKKISEGEENGCKSQPAL